MTTASGLLPLAVRCSGLDEGTLEALVRYGGGRGLEVITGPDWAVVSGSRARLGSLARPWLVPEPLRELAAALGPVLPAEPAQHWQTGRGAISLEQPLIVGILNVTPDSFSDGGTMNSVPDVLARARSLVEQGAGMLDVGGESTRPGRAAVLSESEEAARVLPAVSALARELPAVPLSVDTVKAGVARAALDAGAWCVNDVSGLRLDPALGPLVAERGAGLVLMHSRGSNLELASYDHATYPAGVVATVLAELRQSLDVASAAGVAAEAIAVDPGLGFGKTPEQSVELLRSLEALEALGRPIYVGPSRKRFLGVLTGREVAGRDAATAAACVAAYERGARIFRVHDVAQVRDALAVAAAVAHDSRLTTPET
jgi:dihydropteroate synthase